MRIEELQKLKVTITHEQEFGWSKMTSTSEDSDIDHSRRGT